MKNIIPQNLLLSIKNEIKLQDKKYPGQVRTFEQWVNIALNELKEFNETNDFNKQKCEVVATITCLIRAMSMGNGGYGDCDYCSGKCLRNVFCPSDCNIFWGEEIQEKDK